MRQMLNNYHCVLVDVCEDGQLCNAAGTAVGKCVTPITTGLPCSSSTPGMVLASHAKRMHQGSEEEEKRSVCLLHTNPLYAP